ncbi:MAG: hypothetical protein AAF846_26705 [Chloroflexota bacterium]
MKSIERMSIIMISILLFCIGFPTLAQSPVAVDSTNLSELTATTPQVVFTVSVEAEQTISIQLTAITQELALQAVVFDGNNALELAIGNPDNLNTVSGEFTSSVASTYTIQVSSSNDEIGEFVIRLSTLTEDDICEAYVFDAVEAIADVCSTTGRNQACLGNLNMNATPVANLSTPFSFEQVGDIVNIVDVESFQSSPLNLEQDEWGVALLVVQADIPDTLPGQNVTMLLFGDVELNNSSVSDPELAIQYQPMQAFYFRTGIGAEQCSEVSETGILIQTPDIDAEITFLINEVAIELGSTAFLSFSENSTLDIDLLEGNALVSSQSQSTVMTSGQRVSVPVDEEFIAVAPPNAPIPIPDDAPKVPVMIPETSLVDDATATPVVIGERPPLPTDGACILRTFETDNNPNVRSIPSETASIVSFIVPDETYPVIGRNSEGTWYEISTGWVAGFVTERGGDCSNLPVTYVPPTATPLPTVTPMATPTSALPIAGNNSFSITIDAEIIGVQSTLSGNISSPEGVMRDSVTYSIINARSSTAGDSLSYSITCTGQGVEHAKIFFDDGSVRDCSPTTSNFLDMGFNRLSQVISIGFNEAVQDAYVTWTMSFSVQG